MAKDKITDYSATNASNTDVGGVGIQGTNTISNFDNGLREVMTHLAETNAGTAPLADTFCVADPADLTKKVRIDAGLVTAGQTRVLTMSDANLTLATMAGQAANAVAITGGTINGTTIGATTTASIAGTTGTFSGAVSGTTGSFSSTLTGATFVATTTNAIFSPSAAGTIFLRPNGVGSTSGQVTIASGGTVTLNGALSTTGGGSMTGTWSDMGTVTTVDINGGTIDGAVIGGSSAAAISGTTGSFTSTLTGATFVATTINAIFSTSAAGTVFLRPNGVGSPTGQLTVGSAGAVTLNGSLTASSGGSLTGTWSDHGTITTVDINGGTVDGAVIGGSSAAAGTFTSLTTSGTVAFTSTGTTGPTISSTDAGATGGPFFTLFRNSASPAASDNIGVIRWSGNDATATETVYADIFATITDTTNGSEDGTLTIRNIVAGTTTTQAQITATGWNSMNIGATTRGTAAFTTLAANSTVTFTNGGSMTGTWSDLGTVTTVAITTGNITTGNFGTFSATGATRGIQIVNGANMWRSSVATAVASSHHLYYNTNGNVGSIQTDTNSTLFNTTSDYRLKTDVQDFLGSGEMIDALRPVSYLWKAGNNPGIGFIAHEVQEVFPGAVAGEKDGAEMQGGDWSKLVPVLVAELKSLRARVAELEAA